MVTGNAAGGLLLSSNEVERYLRLYINLGNIDGKQLVPEVNVFIIIVKLFIVKLFCIANFEDLR